MKINILRYFLFGIARGQELDHIIYPLTMIALLRSKLNPFIQMSFLKKCTASYQVLSLFLLATVFDVVTDEVREGIAHKNQDFHVDDLVLMSDSVKGIHSKFANWKNS